MIQPGHRVDDSEHDGRFDPIIDEVEVSQANWKRCKCIGSTSTPLTCHKAVMLFRHTQSPVREALQKLHVRREGEDVHEVEKDVHYNDDSQMDQAVQADAPHLPFFSGQVGLISLKRTVNSS